MGSQGKDQIFSTQARKEKGLKWEPLTQATTQQALTKGFYGPHFSPPPSPESKDGTSRLSQVPKLLLFSKAERLRATWLFGQPIFWGKA